MYAECGGTPVFRGPLPLAQGQREALFRFDGSNELLISVGALVGDMCRFRQHNTRVLDCAAESGFTAWEEKVTPLNADNFQLFTTRVPKVRRFRLP